MQLLHYLPSTQLEQPKYQYLQIELTTIESRTLMILKNLTLWLWSSLATP